MIFLQHNIDYPAIIFGIIFLVIIGGCIAMFIYKQKRSIIRRTFRKIPEKNILLAKENEYIKVIGNTNPIDEPLIAPLSKRRCVYYQITVEQVGESGVNNRNTNVIIDEEKCINFSIESLESKAIVKTTSLEDSRMVHLKKDRKFTSDIWNGASDNLQTYLNSKGMKSTFFGLSKSMAYYESVIEIGEKIAVAGMAHWIESDHKLDQYSSKNLCISGNKANKLLITNDPEVMDTN
ncbi:hypothetical protein [Aquimarina mytili]|uniref:RING-type E3 ubiquitin transferase n=1 Tax=Aquimarina mytili TaxID=874423 RepID=A0A937D8E4_9FLAO|nr:hypothetical protein [Aquimarina mytili]MBL0683980.1 hypothetical protein [Aquimarina mytili]